MKDTFETFPEIQAVDAVQALIEIKNWKDRITKELRSSTFKEHARLSSGEMLRREILG